MTREGAPAVFVVDEVAAVRGRPEGWRRSDELNYRHR
jgi:hypothetical protein